MGKICSSSSHRWQNSRHYLGTAASLLRTRMCFGVLYLMVWVSVEFDASGSACTCDLEQCNSARKSTTQEGDAIRYAVTRIIARRSGQR